MHPLPAQSGLDSVLVLDADVSPSLAVVRSLGRMGLTIHVAAHINDPLSRYSRYAARSWQYPDPLEHTRRFVKWIEQRLAGDQYRLIIPVTERTAIAMLELLEQPDYRQRIALPEPQILSLALDKARTVKLAQSVGVRCPDSYLLERIEQLAAIPDQWQFPVVLKPVRSIASKQHKSQSASPFKSKPLSVQYADSQTQLIRLAEQLLDWGPVLIQSLVKGESHGVEVIAQHGQIKAVFQHQRLHEVPLSGGGSSLRISVELNPILLDAATRLIAAMRWHGVAMVEFKYSPADKNYALMEVNGRFWGSLPLSIAAGVDFPKLLYQLMVNGQISSPANIRQGIVMRKLSLDLYWMELVIRRQGPPAIVKFPPKRQLIRDMLLAFSPRHYFDIQQFKDWRPGWVDLRRIGQSYWQRIQQQGLRYRYHRQQVRAWRHWRKHLKLGSVKQVLFVCYGNINRSAIAEQLFKSAIGKQSLIIKSAGFHREPNRPADPNMCRIAEQKGIDLSDWQSSTLNAALVETSDVILVMEFSQREQLIQTFPKSRHKTLLLGMLSAQARIRSEIPDPYAQSEQHYRACFEQVSLCTRELASLFRS